MVTEGDRSLSGTLHLCLTRSRHAPTAFGLKAEPGVVAQLADLLGRDEARPQHAMFGQVGEPDRIDLVGLRPARYRCHRPDDRQLVAEDVVDAFK